MSGWVLTFVTLAAYLFAAPRNWGTHNGLLVFQSLILLTLALISSPRVPLCAYRRLAALSFMLVVVATAAHIRNGELLAALFSTSPFAVFLIVAYGVRVAFLLTVLLHIFFLIQGMLLGQQDVATLLVYLSISFLWSLVTAIFITVLMVRINDDLIRINALLAQQSRLVNVISHELRVPAMTLSILTKRERHSISDLTNMRDAADQLILVIDNLRSSTESNDPRPLRNDRVRLENFVMQVGLQFKPIIADLGLELYTDVSDPDDYVMLVDRFRLRAVIGNLLRTVAHYSDGDKIWLNAQTQGSPRSGFSRCVIEIEDNCGGISEQTARDLLTDPDISAAEASSTGQGLWVALGWLTQMAGDITYYASPRGGSGFRVALDLAFDLAGTTSPDSTGLLGPWDGMHVLVVEHDEVLKLMIVRELSRIGMFVDEAHTIAQAAPMLAKKRYALQIYDAEIPDQDAKKWLSSVNKADEQLPVIVICAANSYDAKAGLMNAGADVVLEKPLHPSDLGAALQSLVALGAIKRAAES